MLLPLLMQLGMLGRDRHDGYHELGDPYRKVEKTQESVRESLERVINPPKVDAPQVVEVLTAKPIEGAHGVLGGDLRNMEIAMLMERARMMDEDEAIIMLMVH